MYYVDDMDPPSSCGLTDFGACFTNLKEKLLEAFQTDQMNPITE